MPDLDPVNGLRGVVHPTRPTADTSWRPFTPATVTIPTARLTEWAGLLRQLSVHVPLEGPARDQALEAAQLMQWWADHCMTPSRDTVQAPDVAAPIDWLARFRAAAEVADEHGWAGTARTLYDLASQLSVYVISADAPLRHDPQAAALTEAIGRALLGTDTAAPLTERPLADDPGLPLSALFDNRDPHQDEMRSGGDQ